MFEKCPFEECHEILKHSKANTFVIEKHVDMKLNILMWIEKTSYEEYKKQRDNGLGIEAGFPIDGIPIEIKLDNNTSKEDYNKLQQYIREGKVKQFSHEEASRIVQQNVDPAVYTNWNNCMQGMIECAMRNSYGLQKEITYRGKEIIVKLWYFATGPDDTWPVIKAEPYFPPEAKCVHDCLKKDDIISREITMNIHRISPGNGTILINTNKGAIEVPLVPDVTENSRSVIIERIRSFVEKSFTESGGVYKRDKPGCSENLTWEWIKVNEFNITGTILTLRIEIVATYHAGIKNACWPVKATMESTFDISDPNLGNTSIPLKYCVFGWDALKDLPCNYSSEESDRFWLKGYFNIEEFSILQAEVADLIFATQSSFTESNFKYHSSQMLKS